MNPEDIVADVANELIFNDFTASNTLGAVVGAVATVGFLGVTGPITVPLALAGGALVGAKGEEALNKNILRSKYPEQREDWIDGEHMKTFGGWLQTRLINGTVGEQLYLLAKQPSSTISTFQGY